MREGGGNRSTRDQVFRRVEFLRQGDRGDPGRLAQDRLCHQEGEPEDLRPFPRRLRCLLRPQARLLFPVQGRDGSQRGEEDGAHQGCRGTQEQHRVEEGDRKVHRTPEAVERNRRSAPQEERAALEAVPRRLRRVLCRARQERRSREQLLRKSKGEEENRRGYQGIRASGRCGGQRRGGEEVRSRFPGHRFRSFQGKGQYHGGLSRGDAGEVPRIRR